MESSVYPAITQPEKLWSRSEVLARPAPTPIAAGVYGWYFRDLPFAADTSKCTKSGEYSLLYVGISPHAPAAATGVPSKGTLRTRLRAHFSGNASASTLRLTLGLVIGLHLRMTGNDRFTFGDDEARLNEWMAEHARVAWAATTLPWLVEAELIETLNLPLNVRGNNHHPYWQELSDMRRAAKTAARLEAQGAGV